MAYELTSNAKLASQKINLEPQLVLEIEGVSTLYGVRLISKTSRIGDDKLVIGGGWKIGGQSEAPDQAVLISYPNGTTSSINQQLDPSKGAGSSISSIQIALTDAGGKVTRLITPGLVVDDVLGRRAKVYLGLKETSFPEDYITVFRGIIDDIQAKPGAIVLNVAHPDQKKRQTLFSKQTVTVTGVSGGLFFFDQSEINLLYQIASSEANGLKSYLKHGDEYIKFQKVAGVNALSFERAQLGTAQNSEVISAGTELESFYVLEGNIMDLALKLMLSSSSQSDFKVPYLKDFPISSFRWISQFESVDQGLFFYGVNLIEKFGVRAGDYITTSLDPVTGTNYFPNQSVKITDVVNRFDGTLIVVDKGNANFEVIENRTPNQTISIFSSYDVLGVGLGMKPDEVDIDEHERIKRVFLSNFNVRFYMKDEVNLKEFIEEQLYMVAGAYSLPRKSKASVGMHIGPIPGLQTAIISAGDITNAKALTVRRGISNNFTNTILYKFDEDLEEDEFKTNNLTTDEDSINRIKVGTRATIIEARGIRSDLNGRNIANQASVRRLNRYKFAAESIDNIQLTFKKGFTLEIGDVFLFDATGLNLVNTKDGDRSPRPRLFEIINKQMNLRTGIVTISIVDTAYSTSKRYGLISPSSRIKQGISQTQFVIEQAFASQYGANEYLKWARLMPSRGSTVGVKVRSNDFTTRLFETTIKSIIGNTIEVNDPLGFVPQPGDWLEFANYGFEGTTEIQKSLYGYMNNEETFESDDGLQYSML